jgi:hypothetical protein
MVPRKKVPVKRAAATGADEEDKEDYVCGSTDGTGTIKLGDHTLGDYKLHDVRMFRATQLARSMVQKMTPPKTAEEWQEKFDAVCEACGDLLVDTASAARNTYIDPAAFDAWKVHEKRFNEWITVKTVGPTGKTRSKKIGNAAAIMRKMRVMYGMKVDDEE